VRTQAEYVSRIFLLAGILEEGIRCAEAEELPRGRAGVGQPLRDGCAKATDPRMLLDGRDKGEACEGVSQAVFVQWLYGMEANDFGGDTLRFQRMRRFDRLRQHVAGREQAHIIAARHRDGLADREIRKRHLMYDRLALLAQADVDRAILLQRCPQRRADFEG